MEGGGRCCQEQNKQAPSKALIEIPDNNAYIKQRYSISVNIIFIHSILLLYLSRTRNE